MLKCNSVVTKKESLIITRRTGKLSHQTNSPAPFLCSMYVRIEYRLDYVLSSHLLW